MSYNELSAAVRSCAACACRREARSPVPFVGPADAGVMIVGRNPGQDEDAMGVPFVGPGGRELDSVLAMLGLKRERFLITNAAKCYTSGDRPPTDPEYRTCISLHLAKELSLFRPKLVVALGNDCFRWLTREIASVTQRRQRFYDLTSIGAKVMGTLHPGSALRQNRYRVMMQEDFSWLIDHPLFAEAYGPP